MELRSLLLALVATTAAYGLARQCRRAGPLDLGLPVVALGVALFLTAVALFRLVGRLVSGENGALFEAPQLAPAPAENPGPRLRRRARRGACTPPPPG